MKVFFKSMDNEKSKWLGVIALGLSWTWLGSLVLRIAENWILFSDFFPFLVLQSRQGIFFLIGFLYF